MECVVIGAGVVGLATARALAQAGRETIVVERNPRIGEETSSRNSEVIHAGLYYPTDSLKARLCVIGKQSLYDYCELRQIPHSRCGKLIVATASEQLGLLGDIRAQAARNGVGDLEELSAGALRSREPEVRGVGALWSPSTGIIDSHALMLSLQGDLETAGGMVALQTAVESMQIEPDRIRLGVRSSGETSELTARTVINAAGLGAIQLAKSCPGIDATLIPELRLAKGNYFSLRGKSPFSTLIYPLPEDGGLGIHATIDLRGNVRFGPDVEWIDEILYTVDPNRRAAFADAIRRYWPRLRDDDLAPDYAGIRPKLVGPGEPASDFRIDLATRGANRQLINLFGIESPGLTAALAIANEIRSRLDIAAA